MHVSRCGGRGRRRRLAGQLVGERVAPDERSSQRRAGTRLRLCPQRQRVLVLSAPSQQQTAARVD